MEAGGLGAQTTCRGRGEIRGVYRGVATSCPLSWSVQHNFVRDGKQSERGRACTSHLYQAGLIFPLPLCVYSVVGWMVGNMLKVPKCEILDRSDFHYFYTIKLCWVDDFVVKILTYYFNFWGSQASFIFLCVS